MIITIINKHNICRLAVGRAVAVGVERELRGGRPANQPVVKPAPGRDIVDILRTCKILRTRGLSRYCKMLRDIADIFGNISDKGACKILRTYSSTL